MVVISSSAQFLVRIRDIIRDLLWYLKSHFWIQSDALQITDHNVYHRIF